MSAIVETVSSGKRAPSAHLDTENSHTLASLWWAMHHSDDPDLQALVVSCYLDESATDGSTPIAVVGGLLINSLHFVGLDKKWRAMLDEFSLWPGLHMKDFGRHHRFAHMPPDKCESIFTRAAEIIKEHNICTIAATLEQDRYKALLSRGLRRYASAYGLCFMACVAGSHKIAQAHNYQKRVAFVVDPGNPYAEQVFFMHQALVEAQTDENFLNLGSLTFDKDDNVTALQAADVVCWAVRRRATGYPFVNGFEPIEKILDDQAHNQAPYPEDAMRDLRARLKAAKPEILEEP
jgi:hypothetical protein